MIRSFDEDKTAIIMLTGYNWDIVAEEALRGGVDSIGAKPLFPDSLQREIRSVLVKKEGGEVVQEEEGKAFCLHMPSVQAGSTLF